MRYYLGIRLVYIWYIALAWEQLPRPKLPRTVPLPSPMAKLTLHELFPELRGKLGGLVVRKIRGRYYLSRKPESHKKPTTGQKAFRARFRQASNYARAVQRNPELKAFYEPLARKLDLRVRAVAISDWFHPPKVEALDLSGYRGRAGDVIKIRARAKIGVQAVHVRIVRATGELLEQGDATGRGSNTWHYTATTDALPNTPLRIEAQALTRPHHSDTLKQPWTA